MGFPERVEIVEVGPRDGLQNEPRPLPWETKVELIERLGQAGLPVIEAGAFVSPKWVPQMADSEEVLRHLRRHEGVSYPVLVPNMKGLERAMAVDVQEIAIFGAASETFSRRNINCGIAESLERFAPVCKAARAAGISVRGYVSCVLGCPYEGEVAPAAVAALARELMSLGCREVSLGDTIGVGTPAAARRMLEAVADEVGHERLAVHYHDTYGQALANIYASLEFGVSTIDCSVAGLGGCPYAKGASGNVASEDVIYMLDGLRIETGVDLEALVAVSWFISEQLDRTPASRVALAMGRPND